MILTVTLNPSVDHALFVDGLKLCDTNRVLRTEVDAGGKGVNLSRVAVEMGAMSVATGFLGGGNAGFIRKVLVRQHVLHDFVDVHGETRTNFSVEDGTGAPPTTFNERGPTISEDEYERLIEKLDHYAPRAAWVAFGGSIPQGLQAETYRDLVRRVRKHGARVVLDADGDPMRFGIEARPDFIKPNAREAERLLGLTTTIPDLASAVEAARRLQVQTEGLVVISCGEQGAVAVDRDGSAWSGESPRVEVRSTIGSGDSLIAGMLAAFEAGRGFPEALAWGIAAGAATATTDGSEIGRKPTIDALLPSVRVTEATPLPPR
ncbi:MAG TPA: 1-phosphofructokinase [Fimbriimonadaceae bacterium]|nr:1-phosphofructokinase [Fimbriimonadaceae bacterium]